MGTTVGKARTVNSGGMMDETFCFHVEPFGDGYRATLNDNFVHWEYGEDPYEAIANLCTELSYESQQSDKTES